MDLGFTGAKAVVTGGSKGMGLAIAETLGADITFPGSDGVVAKVREFTQGRGADVIIETTGVVAALSTAIHMARPGGRVLMFGIITANEGALPFYELYYKELALITARVAKSEDYPGAIGLVERGHVMLEPLISDVMPLGQLKDAIGLLGSDSGPRMKIIMEHQ